MPLSERGNNCSRFLHLPTDAASRRPEITSRRRLGGRRWQLGGLSQRLHAGVKSPYKPDVTCWNPLPLAAFAVTIAPFHRFGTWNASFAPSGDQVGCVQ